MFDTKLKSIGWVVKREWKQSKKKKNYPLQWVIMIATQWKCEIIIKIINNRSTNHWLLT